MASRRDTQAVAEAMFAGEGGPPPAERIRWLCDDFDDFIERAGPRSELILGGAVFAATWLAPVALGKRPPLARLSIEERVEALDRLEKTPAGLPLLALKAILCTIYFEHAEAQREAGIELGCHGGKP
jgi:hypothetical protein